jgi:hypothetical protein
MKKKKKKPFSLQGISFKKENTYNTIMLKWKWNWLEWERILIIFHEVFNAETKKKTGYYKEVIICYALTCKPEFFQMNRIQNSWCLVDCGFVDYFSNIKCKNLSPKSILLALFISEQTNSIFVLWWLPITLYTHNI